ncbi:hypothetical protein GCM10009716_14970 [Streptomyces sodiiphilus]|uniref:DoxX family protein n=1 Tax=Streptomyces sodiiphilus TaxID=226217 RepID=A0ABN2NX53_9ACTN
MRVTAAIVSALLIFEFSLAALTWTPVLQVAVDRFTELTRITPSPALMVTIGLLDALGVAGVIAGFWRPWAAVAGASWFVLLCGSILIRQLYVGDRGLELVPYALFTSAAVILIATRLADSG